MSLGSRIVIVGSSGSGKSTLGKALAKSRGFSFVELDALHWDPGWEAASAEEFLRRVGGGWQLFRS
jgi:adenylate kinase family enzyme